MTFFDGIKASIGLAGNTQQGKLLHKSSWLGWLASLVFWILTLSFCCGPNAAKGLPPDRIFHLKPESGQFAKSPPGAWQAYIQDNSIATATVFDTQEIFIEGHKPGTTLLLLSNMKLRAVLVWQVSVSFDPGPRVPTKPDQQLAQLCHCTPEFKCRIRTWACVSKLQRFLQNAHLTTSDIQLLYTPETLKKLTAELNQQISKAALGQIELSFSGVNLRLRGEIADTQTWRRLMLVLYQHMVGKLFLEDQLSIRALDEQL